MSNQDGPGTDEKHRFMGWMWPLMMLLIVGVVAAVIGIYAWEGSYMMDSY